MSNFNLSFESVPQEILEHIAFFAATSSFVGPPAGIIPMLLTNRTIHSHLAPSSNPHLYARIFVAKFDLAHATRRLGPDRTSAAALSDELQRRFTWLTRVRGRSDTKVVQDPVVSYDEAPIQTILWTGYLMMLENDGKNAEQLRSYAGMEEWLKEYWFDPQGASLATLSIRNDGWPPSNEQNALAMWLFWFLLRPETIEKDTITFRNITTILKLMALGAHKYDLASPSWIEFLPSGPGRTSYPKTLYSQAQDLTPQPMAAPAILSFLTLTNKLHGRTEHFSTSSSMASLRQQQSHEWETEWQRCLNLGKQEFDKVLSGAFTPGSIEGVWEGVFTYTEFTAYAALLAGAPPPILHKSLVAQHNQTWKLREYHLVAAGLPSAHSVAYGGTSPLAAGDPLKAYFPDGTQIFDRINAIEVREPGRIESLFYQRPADVLSNRDYKDPIAPTVQDIIIIGEGHSAWGQFNLLGRVRPCDGLVSLSKDYIDGDRGKWLYRSYLVGNSQGSLAGRWRDTLSPPNVPGYEGCFAMSRRR